MSDAMVRDLGCSPGALASSESCCGRQIVVTSSSSFGSGGLMGCANKGPSPRNFFNSSSACI